MIPWSVVCRMRVHVHIPTWSVYAHLFNWISVSFAHLYVVCITHVVSALQKIGLQLNCCLKQASMVGKLKILFQRSTIISALFAST